MTYEQRRDHLLKMMKRQTGQWIKEAEYELWQKSNKPKNTYTFKPKKIVRTKDITDRNWLDRYYSQQK